MNFNNNYTDEEDFDLVDGNHTYSQGATTDGTDPSTQETTPSAPTAPSAPATTDSSAQLSGGQFMVKTLTGKNIVVDYDPNMTVRELKEYINSSSNIPIDQQRLIFQGKQMDNDDYTINDYHVVKDASVHLVLKLRGGVV